ncbi:AI-2E family transporter [Martelella mediterranea]|uniref:AI-2E family transporter n=1 Tax=Martelella mediterranea TaxID=293089 RepID=UPI001E2EC66A|nr:AI-2E family transporter [Martelella mediterranea]MCD1633901.1 AI-2E family transporter [Martelella mediterranea]
MQQRQVQQASFVILTVIASVAFIWLIRPFYGAILWAVVLAILFHPFQKMIAARLQPRRNIAASIGLFVCVCVILIPSALIFIAVAREAARFYRFMSMHDIDLPSAFESLRARAPPFVLQAFDFIRIGSLEELQGRLDAALVEVTQWAAPQALGLGQGAIRIIANAGVLLYILFFLLRDGAALSATVRKSSPLTPRQTEQFLDKFSRVITATVRGSVVIALVQGTIGGIVFWLLGMDGALLWGVVMAFLSLLPVIGAAAVWVPAAFYLLLSGDVIKGLILLATGILVISLVDNLLRPPLVGKGARMPDYLILVSTLGGITLMGVNGFVVGPLIAALFVTVWSMMSDSDSWQ